MLIRVYKDAPNKEVMAYLEVGVYVLRATSSPWRDICSGIPFTNRDGQDPLSTYTLLIEMSFTSWCKRSE